MGEVGAVGDLGEVGGLDGVFGLDFALRGLGGGDKTGGFML